MSRSYHVEIAAITTNCNQKWVDNLLSHHRVPGVTGARQGIARRITPEGLLHILIVRRLIDDLAVTTAHALTLAQRICDSPEGELQLPSGTLIRIDVTVLRRQLETALLELAGVVVPRRRGRPPGRPGRVSDDSPVSGDSSAIADSDLV